MWDRKIKNVRVRSLFFCPTFFCLVLRALFSHSALRTRELGLPLSLLIRDRQLDCKRAAFAGLAPHSDLALMGHDNVFDQRQSEAATLHVMNQAGTDPIKFLENLLLLVGRYADPAVGDGYGHEAVGLGDADVDLFHVA